MKKNETEILEFINNLKGYQGYIQMSDKPISDIWQNFSDISFVPSSGFVYEAHFCNGVESIAIKQINDTWLVSKTSLSEVENKETDIQIYHAINGLKVNMAQIWEIEEDLLCELERDEKGKTIKGFDVLKLKKVVFVGFTKGDNQ